MDQDYGFETDFLYKYLNGSTVKRGERLGFSKRSGMSDIALLKWDRASKRRMITVKDNEGNVVGWSNRYVIIFKEPTEKRPSKWDRDRQDEVVETDFFAPILAGNGRPCWPTRVRPTERRGIGKFVEFVAEDGESSTYNGNFLAALLRKAGKAGRRQVHYRFVGSNPELAVYVDGQAIGAICPIDNDAEVWACDEFAAADIVVTVPNKYHPCPQSAQDAAQDAVDVPETVSVDEPTPTQETPQETPLETPEPEPTPEPVTVPEPEPEPIAVVVTPKTHRGRPYLINTLQQETVPEGEPAFYVASVGEWGVSETARPVYL